MSDMSWRYKAFIRELKACHEQIPRDTKSFVRRYANEIADEMVKEDHEE